MKTRALTPEEIAALENHGCRADDWQDVAVADDFDPGRFRDVLFSGTVRLGRFAAVVDDGDGFPVPAGISRARLRNVSIGNDCLIADAALADVDVGDGAVLRGVASLRREGDTAFSNNSPANVLAEDGARAVPLWRRLSAQMAHLICHRKNHPAGAALEAMIARDAASLRGTRCRVGRGAVVLRTGDLCNVWLGEGARLRGVTRLRDCHVESSFAAPTVLGDGVSAEDSVFLTGSRVDDGCRLVHSLVGEGVVLEHDFFAKYSLFFANARFGLGEAACAMAGPFATSSHRATLILTCQCSFNTFGSASNASNHHFKLGPRHGGVLRRGTRCGSGSYIFWPADIGAFSTVVGKHGGNMDTAAFPFSLLLAQGDISVLVPGASVFTVGLYRDAMKWVDRDRRQGIGRPLDLVNAAILSPYVMEAMDRGVAILAGHDGVDGDLPHKGTVIPAGRRQPALRAYRMALIFYLGECLLRTRAEWRESGWDADALATVLAKEPEAVRADWRDWNGMLLPGDMADAIVRDLAEGRLDDEVSFRSRLEAIHAAYPQYELEWVAARWRREYGMPDRESLRRFGRDWREAVEYRHGALIKDMGKEFAEERAYGFGVEAEATASFRRVRGEAREHPLFAMIQAETERFLRMAEKLA